MTRNKRIVLRFLSNKMEVTAEMVGHHLHGKGIDYSTRSAAAVLGQLRENSFVTRLPELNAWRLTAKGRDYIKTLSNND